MSQQPDEEKKVERKTGEEPEEIIPEERVLRVIRSHPEGIRLVDIGNELGVNWRTFIGAARTLVEEARVEKVDNVYYPLPKEK